MKNLILCITTLFFTSILTCNVNAQDHFDKVIGKLENGKTILTIASGELGIVWENMINSNSDLNLKFEEIIIENKDASYFLIAKDKNATSRINLILDDGNLYEAKDDGGNGVTIICSGCESTGPGSGLDCIPLSADGEHWCSACSGGECTKTVTLTKGRSILEDKKRN